MKPQYKQSPPVAEDCSDFFMNVTIKTPAEQDKMRAAGRLAASVLDMIEPYVLPGVSTDELDKRCHDFIVEELKSIPANLNYRGFPKTICTSVNHVVCHGIPGDKRLKSGDIINIDVTVIRDGFHGDTSRMYLVGIAPILARRLTAACYEAMWKGIEQVKPGARLGDIGHAIQTYAEANNFSVVREYCGHGIGRIYHEDPQVLHYGKPGTGLELTAGMTFTIEPMITAGRRDGRWSPRISPCPHNGNTRSWSPTRAMRYSRSAPVSPSPRRLRPWPPL